MDGIAKAKERGVHFGRKRTLTDDYVLIQEIPEHVDATRLRRSINSALREPP
jgi:hypothetical protein